MRLRNKMSAVQAKNFMEQSRMSVEHSLKTTHALLVEGSNAGFDVSSIGDSVTFGVPRDMSSEDFESFLRTVMDTDIVSNPRKSPSYLTLDEIRKPLVLKGYKPQRTASCFSIELIGEPVMSPKDYFMENFPSFQQLELNMLGAERGRMHPVEQVPTITDVLIEKLPRSESSWLRIARDYGSQYRSLAHYFTQKPTPSIPVNVLSRAPWEVNYVRKVR